MSVTLIALAIMGQPSLETTFTSKNTFISYSNLDIHIEFDTAFHYLGSHPVSVDGVAEGTRYIYIDDDKGKVMRLWIVHVEKIIPTSSEEFNYDFRDALNIKGHKFRTNVFAFSNKEADEAADSIAAKTTSLLTKDGLTYNDEWAMQRFVAVPDAARKHEIIISYVEGMDALDIGLSEAYNEDWTLTPKMEEISKGFKARAISAFTIKH